MIGHNWSILWFAAKPDDVIGLKGVCICSYTWTFIMLHFP